jgi:TRAP-type mannitol/chloroaromatic compound transport system permease large subunit
MSACRRSQPDIPLRDVIWGVLPFVALMIFAVVLMCVFPGIATWFPDAVMGGKTR